MNDPELTRGNLRLNQQARRRRGPFATGDDLLEAETIMQDVTQRRRRVSGPAHPHTLHAEILLSAVRRKLARA